MITKEVISEWFDRGVEKGATHMLIVCDTFDYDDYPVFVAQNENVLEVEMRYNGRNMQKIMEIYNLGIDKQIQLGMHRCFQR